MALFTTSQVVTAAQLNALVGYAVKTADESVTSSTTLQDDDHLSYTVATTGSFVFDIYAYALSAANAAGDLNVAMAFPTGTCHWGVHGLDPAIASGTLANMQNAAYAPATSGVSVHAVGLSTTASMVWIHGLLVATATGTLKLQWAQNSSNASASTLKAGSHMRVTQVA